VDEPDGRAILIGRDLHHSFGPTPALNGISISVADGEVVAVMGPSGSGKSTLLHCLSGIIRPRGGTVTFRGERIDRLREQARTRLRRDRFGFVFQSGQLVAELTGRENVALPMLLRGERNATADERAAAWLDRLGVTEAADRRPGQMSVGQAQRVAVARALVHGPEVLFADEPTGALDSLGAEQVIELIVEAAKQEGTAVLLVTHDPKVAAYADREIVVRDGRAIAHAEIP
jgi:putative ABC transport system ATP-binding protein